MRYLVLLLAMVLPSLTAACQEVAPRELNLYNWENYLAPGIIEGFEAEFGIQVNLEYFDSEEAMLSAVQSDPSRYDLVITSDSMVSTLIDLKLLAPLDLKEIPNFENVAPSFKDLPHDPENAYSVPYLWGTMGMALNTEFIPRDTPS